MSEIEHAKAAIQNADALLITAGAGIGVDSGLPDFRGDEGFWRAYPPFAEAGLSFVDMANPQGFQNDPELAWGFYGHRLNLYRQTVPHAGFQILREMIGSKPMGGFVFTSNVDGQFQKAGFENVVEAHGSIHHFQCAEPCCEEIWPADELQIEVDESTFRAEEPLPMCPQCGKIARPNILMFYDGQWLWKRSEAQQDRFKAWLGGLSGRELTIIEIGAGTNIPTVRRLGEDLQRGGANLIRINPREPEGPSGTISLSSGALQALSALQIHIPPPTSQ